ncbi:hypothetical protein HY045_02665 [Candidatus Woesebacteria bacterium]|nr:hypothetical protein [Candidatus Woesebacteria bacterium]
MHLKNLLKKYPFLNYSVLAMLLNLTIVIIVLFAQKLLPPEVPLLYGMPESTAQLTKSIYLTVPNLLALVLVIVNSALAIVIKNDFLNKILTMAALVVSIFCAITTLRIILLVSGI